jgi:hypothetical protein
LEGLYLAGDKTCAACVTRVNPVGGTASATASLCFAQNIASTSFGKQLSNPYTHNTSTFSLNVKRSFVSVKYTVFEPLTQSF